MNRPFTWGDEGRSTPVDDRAVPQPSARCYLCGIVLPTDLMMADGGQACADIRWYCQDTKACTERWTAKPPRRAHLAPNQATPQAPADPDASEVAGPGARSDVVDRPALAGYQAVPAPPVPAGQGPDPGGDLLPAVRSGPEPGQLGEVLMVSVDKASTKHSSADPAASAASSRAR